ncbi:MAG: sigma-E processing peptidase SpoIIGA [Oscillospiraceae bacterium]|nr:sigma-E processing peptidase SpoIIGA [Oscillospiraceae bacterium]
MYIYVDILIITNIYANFFLLKTTARLIHTPLRNGKCILGAMVGSLFSLIILLPPINSVLLLMIRILSAAFMITVTFGEGKSSHELFRIGTVFFFVCFIFAGIEYGLAVLSAGKNMLWHNSTLYVNISLLTLVISTIVSYAAICFFRYYMDGRNSADIVYDLIITKDGKTISVKAVEDTCNNLTDAFTGKPVIVCGRSSVSDIIDENIFNENLPNVKGWRLIPFSTINSEGMLPIFKPSGVIVKNTENGSVKSIDVYIGVVSKEMEHAVFNPKILH